jgi:hypothetical protein
MQRFLKLYCFFRKYTAAAGRNSGSTPKQNQFTNLLILMIPKKEDSLRIKGVTLRIKKKGMNSAYCP